MVFPEVRMPCDICHERRPEHSLGINMVVLAGADGRQDRRVEIKYCNENPHCVRGAIKKLKELTNGPI